MSDLAISTQGLVKDYAKLRAVNGLNLSVPRGASTTPMPTLGISVGSVRTLGSVISASLASSRNRSVSGTARGCSRFDTRKV